MRYDHIVVTRRGGSEVLEQQSAESAAPGPGQAVVRVETAGVSYGDILLRTGVIPNGPTPPFTPGFDLVGKVHAVGPGVTEVSVGQRVTALVHEGGYSELISLPATRLVPVPDALDPVPVAASMLNYFIAYQMLHRVAKVREGQTVLVHGAAGGVGTAFLQLAAMAGVTCYGTSSAAKRQVVTKYGGNHIDYRSKDFVSEIRALPGGGVDAVFDAIGGTHFRRSYRVLNRNGILVAYGQSQALQNGRARKLIGAVGFLGGIALPKLFPDSKSTVFYNAWYLEKRQPEAYAEDIETILDLLANRKIEPVIAQSMPLHKAREAHDLLERAATVGKIVLTCGADATTHHTTEAGNGAEASHPGNR